MLVPKQYNNAQTHIQIDVWTHAHAHTHMYLLYTSDAAI